MNIGAVLKMFGVTVDQKHIKAAEDLIPKVPALVNEVVTKINAGMNNFDQRLRALEASNQEILGELRNGRIRDNDHDDDTRPAGIGGTQRELERIGVNGAD